MVVWCTQNLCRDSSSSLGRDSSSFTWHQPCNNKTALKTSVNMYLPLWTWGILKMCYGKLLIQNHMWQSTLSLLCTQVRTVTNMIYAVPYLPHNAGEQSILQKHTYVADTHKVLPTHTHTHNLTLFVDWRLKSMNSLSLALSELSDLFQLAPLTPPPPPRIVIRICTVYYIIQIRITQF